MPQSLARNESCEGQLLDFDYASQYQVQTCPLPRRGASCPTLISKAQRIDITIDETELRDALGRFASGVTVVTTQGPAGQLLGMTASAFCSVSLDPPLILVCVNHEASIYPSIRDGKTFCVNVLNENQGTIAYEFADRDLDMTDRVQWRLSDLGNPLLQDFQALFECRLEHEYPGGDHAIVVGRVQALEINHDTAPPLLYFRGKFDIDSQ